MKTSGPEANAARRNDSAPGGERRAPLLHGWRVWSPDLIDRGLVGQRRQCDTNRACAVFHGATPVHQRFGEARRAVVAAGWAKISK